MADKDVTRCSVEGCSRQKVARGFCNMHYSRWKKTGDPGDSRRRMMRNQPAEERFWEKVQKTDGCWIWLGARKPLGYGSFAAAKERVVPAHRFAYELLLGPIPDGLVIDHLCRNPSCVNPEHLEAVTQQENTLRGVGWAGTNGRKSHCMYGHEFTPENTRIKAGGGRICRTCKREADARYRTAA